MNKLRKEKRSVPLARLTLVALSMLVSLSACPRSAFAQPLQGGTDSTTLQGGTDSTTLQGGTDSTTLQGGTAGTTIHGGTQRDGGPVTILFLVDASLSMKENLERGVQKMDAAKLVLQKAISKIPNDVNLGLRVFGHFNSPMVNPCESSALLVPPGTRNRRAIIEKMRDVHPTGMTPLTYAIAQAAERDLARVQGKKTIILISDGEDTCGFDPCAYIQTLPARGVSLKVDILGLNMEREKSARKQLDCIAKSSGGKYYDNDTSAKLIESLSHSVSQALSGSVILPGQQPAEKPQVLNIETPPELTPIIPAQSLDDYNKQKRLDDKAEEAAEKEAEKKEAATKSPPPKKRKKPKP